MILVIGESCMDVFHYGECERLCPEAPVPVFNSTRTVENGGMAMNVYNNIQNLGGNVEILTNPNWKDIKKTRFVEEKSNHMFMRLDENDKSYGNISLNKLNFDLYDAIIVSDYNKGYLSTDVLEKISQLHPLTFLDTKKILGDWSENFTYIKINGLEYDKTKHTINKNLYSKLIITQGQKGSIHKQKRYHVPMVEVKDVSGAGDTFISGLCYYYLKTKSIEESINFANECATKVVQKRGVSTV
jgi:D-beta-D-heptose 7-phosphate kinase/D-beta-D-heptose 1-phosphate adenosyltransferase